MKNLMTTVSNSTDQKQYFVSTVECPGSKELYQAAVFQKIFGPFANFHKPKATFFGRDSTYLHRRITTLVSDVDSADWDIEELFITVEGDEVDAAFEAMIAGLRTGA